MPHPARNPQHQYSESTIWWPCSICSKPCKSKRGRTQHIRQVHGNTFDNSITFDETEDEPIQLDHGNLSPINPNGIREEEDMDAAEPMDFDFRVATPLSDASSSNDSDIQEHDNSQGQGSRSSIGSTTCHPIMNGRWCDRNCWQ
jgi:hypothetical protein